ncbi:FeoA family protein [Thiomonas bhubaneswarensis]|uniref:Fe2+ transport system protein FeoA n=1 Tax=Thiomonas bhubaneswarensis TaxID=339866 RepID=A0A0K6I5M0_9BURK|nr:FeoA domain-containing protein [Thiomonas bhubaneswarensis]CUA98430.1 Fe2+ transport system protein FeoA [Thiomonas bhubaneswarensis]
MSIHSQTMSLAQLMPGQCAEVVEVDGGRAMTQRMLMLGIRRGTGLCVVQGPSKRGVVVRVGGARIALGHGVTERIRVQPANLRAGVVA